ncbi:hypothetical protein, partial [Escherichia coli]|uniref:hypothetical protein n=1 Tax=Escherichia coli TaxID=562 RepID=UPI0029166897
KRAYCLKTQPATGETYPKSDLFNKAFKKLNHFNLVVNATCILLTLRYDGKYVCGNIFNNSPARCIFLFLFIPKY